MPERNFIEMNGINFELPEELQQEASEQETVYNWKGEIQYEVEQNA